MKKRHFQLLLNNGILIALVVCGTLSCNRITVTDDDRAILAESNQLLEQDQMRAEKQLFSTLHRMNTNVRNSGNRPEDLEKMSKAVLIWKNYKTQSQLLEDANRSKADLPTDSLNLYEISMEKFGDEFKARHNYPLTGYKFHTISHLKREFARSAVRILDEGYRLRVGGYYIHFDPIRLAIIETNENVEMVFPLDERGDFYQKIGIPKKLKDTVAIADFSPFFEVEYIDGDTYKLTMLDPSGQQVTLEFPEIAKIQLLN